MADLARRGFITGGLGALICAPAIVRIASLMPVKTFCFDRTITLEEYQRLVLAPMIDKFVAAADIGLYPEFTINHFRGLYAATE